MRVTACHKALMSVVRRGRVSDRQTVQHVLPLTVRRAPDFVCLAGHDVFLQHPMAPHCSPLSL